jgi:hypothetical protein
MNPHPPAAVLPTPRTLLNSLLNSLTLPPPLEDSPPTSSSPPAGNPLKTLPPAHRALLTTLHVLFPPPTLLQALDLLDRGLVTRLVLLPPPQDHPSSADPAAGEPNAGTTKNKPENAVYIVHSSQSRNSRAARAGRVYEVRLEAWSCSCAAFAFAAFPGAGQGWEVQEEGGEWERERGAGFGGGCLDGHGERGGQVPVCKHLLACFLGERWRSVLGCYVKEREIGREEMVGVLVGGEVG